MVLALEPAPRVFSDLATDALRHMYMKEATTTIARKIAIADRPMAAETSID